MFRLKLLKLEDKKMKEYLGPVNCLYPMPITIVGSILDERVNYMPVAHVGIMNLDLQNYISVSMAKIHYTTVGIKENKTFSVNIPSQDLVVETDYCGLVSGYDVNKSKVFETFYGELKTAPLIRECPINMECQLYKVLDFKTHDLFIGEIISTYANKEVLTSGQVDMDKLKPILFDMSSKKYFKLGESFAKCWGVGRSYKK